MPEGSGAEEKPQEADSPSVILVGRKGTCYYGCIKISFTPETRSEVK